MTGTPPSSVFIGVSGASGAPYVLRLVQALAARGRDAVTAAFLERAGVAAAVSAADDLAAPPASGSSFPDAAVICPCSVSTVAHIALGTTRTLIHRVGDVALKERRPLVVVPRETPLTQIHLRRLLELAEAGAIVLPAMPAFYSQPQTLQDAVDHVVGKVVAALGFAQTLFPPWDGGRR